VRFFFSLAIAAALLAAHNVSPALAAADPSPAQKQEFLRTICAGWERAQDCLSTGKLVENQSIMWIMFEACSGSGTMAVMIKCFDRASDIAGRLTGDPIYADTKTFCHRFDGESVEFATALCFRQSLRIRNFVIQHYPIGNPQ
jgi:hypothetical protein